MGVAIRSVGTNAGTNRLLKFLSTHGGITVHHVDTTRVEALVPYLNEKTTLVLLETPTNPLIKIVDIPAISRLTHDKCPNGVVVVDNTMLSPYLQNPLDLGADIVYESATKYLSGHHDLMAGVLAVHDTGLGDVPLASCLLTIENILHHQRLRMRPLPLRLLAPTPRGENPRRTHGKTASERNANSPLHRIPRVCNAVSGSPFPPAVRIT
jgi:Cys/Met metabolism PLP-dependent enzyme